MSKRKEIYYARKFLNPPRVNGGAYLLASITKHFYKGRLNKRTGKMSKDSIERDIQFTIADCSRIINLDLEFYGKRDAKQNLKKLDILVDTLIEFRKAYKKEAADFLKEKQ